MFDVIIKARLERLKKRVRILEGNGVLVGYSYNGVILPALPEAKLENAPYMLIRLNKNGTYRLLASQVEHQWRDNAVCSVDRATYYAYDYDGSGEWKLVTAQASVAANLSFCAASDGQTFIWSARDIKDILGNVVHAGSEPVPVYE